MSNAAAAIVMYGVWFMSYDMVYVAYNSSRGRTSIQSVVSVSVGFTSVEERKNWREGIKLNPYPYQPLSPSHPTFSHLTTLSLYLPSLPPPPPPPLFFILLTHAKRHTHLIFLPLHRHITPSRSRRPDPITGPYPILPVLEYDELGACPYPPLLTRNASWWCGWWLY